MRTQRRLFLTQLAVAVAVAGCGDGTGPGDRPAQYQFTLEAWGQDSTAEHRREYSCFLNGLFEVPRPLAANGTVTFPVRVERRLVELQGNHIEQTRADTNIAEAELAYTGLGQSSLSVVLTAGPYSVSLGPGGLGASWPGAYSGEWACGADVPLAQDSTLLAYGYDGELLAPGAWQVFELQPIE